MSAKTNDLLFIAIGGAALLGSCTVAFLQQNDISALRSAVYAPSSGMAHESVTVSVTAPESLTWADARAQTAGEKWVYDVFTPPKIYYNTQSRQFTVVPPVFEDVKPIEVTEGVKPELPTVGAFGMDLVTVYQPLFRLQLVGYVGDGAAARGTFENPVTKEVFIGRAGKKFADLNLEIVSFGVERRRTAVEGGTGLVETVAKAVVRDTVSGVETILTNGPRVPEGAPEATFKLPDGSTRSVPAGGSIVFGDTTFSVGAVTIEPVSAVVTRSGGGVASSETQTLTPPPPPPPPVPLDGAGVPVPAGEAAPAAAFPSF